MKQSFESGEMKPGDFGPPEDNNISEVEPLVGDDAKLFYTAEIQKSRKEFLVKRISKLLMAPESPIGRLAWEAAANIVKTSVEKETQQAESDNQQSIIEENHKELLDRVRILVEVIIDIISRRIVLPLLRLALSNEYRERLQEFGVEYKQLRQLEAMQVDIQQEAHSHSEAREDENVS